MLPVSPEVMKNELETARAIMVKWQEKMDNVPGVHLPANPEELERFLRELIGELQVVSGKCDTLAEALSSAVLG